MIIIKLANCLKYYCGQQGYDFKTLKIPKDSLTDGYNMIRF